MSRMWAVTSYYNPARYHQRLKNFRRFRDALSTPLLAVELAAQGEHQLADGDADVVVRLTGESRIWQKERLINVGVSRLPSHVDVVAWADCDLLLESDWHVRSRAALDRAGGGVVQPFRRVDYLARYRGDPVLFSGTSVAESVRLGEFRANEDKIDAARASGDFATYARGVDRYNAYGMVWVARRDQLAACGLYDANVIGGGDSILVFGAIGELDELFRMRPYSPAHQAHAREWVARGLDCGLLSSLHDVAGVARHMWHGEMGDRSYRGRYASLADNDYDPARDLRLTDNGSWAWADPRGEIARRVRDYFFARREDGRDPPISPQAGSGSQGITP